MQSDLVGLRAELHKKRVEASKYGAGQKGIPRREGERPHKSTSFNIKNAGVVLRDARDKQQEKDETPSEEAARAILEKKALLYEKLHGGVETLEDDTLNEKYLVNFQRKIVDEVKEMKMRRQQEEERQAEQSEREASHPDDYRASRKDEEWVEYTDVLGRTRECMRKDLPHMVEQDKQLLGEDEDEAAIEAALISGQKYREKLHQKWEHEEQVNAFKKDLHYQDVTYDEARMHGTGYMKFSQDEKERKAQMDLLKEMHSEAKTAEQTKKIAAAKKEKLLQARLEKVRQRKRLKLGLPIKDDDKLKTPPASDDEDEMIGPPLPPSLELAVEKPIEDSKAEPKKPKTREWDLGKQGVGGNSILSQEEWLDRQRNQRNDEFAPPSAYNHNKRPRTQNYAASSSQGYTPQNYATTSSQVSTGSGTLYEKDPREEERRSEFAPPSTYEYYGPSNFNSRKQSTKTSYKSMESAVDRGLANLRNLCNQ